MRRNTHSRRHLLTLASSPWTLYEADPNDQGGGGSGAPQVNEHGFPDNTPVADMPPEQQAAYWKHHARKHEQRANAAPDAAEVQRLKDRDAALKAIEDQNLTDAQRADQERQTLAQERDSANGSVASLTDENTRLRVALEKGLTIAQANRLSGTTKEELEADADAYLAEIGQTGGASRETTHGTPPPRSGGNRGGDVGNAGSVSAGEARYAQKHGK